MNRYGRNVLNASLMGLLSFLQSLFGASTPPTHVQLMEEPWHDILLAITNYESRPDGTQIIELGTKLSGREMRYKIVFSETWKSTKIGPIDAFQGGVDFISLGIPSDSFAQYIDKIYGTKIGIQRARPQSRFVAITLKGNPKMLEDGPVQFKLFFEPDDEKQYAELYLNVYLRDKKAEINEKDPDYRPHVALAFGQKG